MIAAGKLDTRLSLRQPSTAQDAIGQPLTTWTEVSKLWANVLYKTGIEAVKADADTSVVKASIRIWFNSAVTPAMRLVNELDGTVFQILSLLPNRRGGYIDLPCEVVK